MIWTAGRVGPDASLGLGPDDRALEHGLGLFETLRTWKGRAVLLDRHRGRLLRSAAALGLPLDPASLPDHEAVAALRRAEAIEADVTLRITVSGGTAEPNSSVAWMRARPLPPPARPGGAALVLAPFRVGWFDPMARHKSLNYWSRRIASEHAQAAGADEALMLTSDGRVWEGARTNLFILRGSTLLTPGSEGPLLPGILRGLVLERAPGLGLEVREEDLRLADVDEADEVFLTNAVRGIIPVGRPPCGTPLDAPGPWTELIRDDLDRWLARGGGGDAP